eukprot:1710978-Rhodomonas_salina.1
MTQHVDRYEERKKGLGTFRNDAELATYHAGGSGCNPQLYNSSYDDDSRDGGGGGSYRGCRQYEPYDRERRDCRGERDADRGWSGGGSGP